MGARQMVAFAIGCIVVIVAAYYTTYFVAKKSTGRKKRSGNIRPIGQMSLGKDKGIYLIETCGSVYLVAMSSHSITLLDTLDVETVTDQEAEGEGNREAQMVPPSLATIADILKKQWKEKGPGGSGEQAGRERRAEREIWRSESGTVDEDTLDLLLKKAKGLKTRDEPAKSSAEEDRGR